MQMNTMENYLECEMIQEYMSHREAVEAVSSLGQADSRV